MKRMGNQQKQKLWKKKYGNLEFQSSASEMKSSSWRQQEEIISRLEDRSTENAQFEKQGKGRGKQTMLQGQNTGQTYGLIASRKQQTGNWRSQQEREMGQQRCWKW